MKRGKGVHTVPVPGGGWMNELDGEAITKHRVKALAVQAGRGIAMLLHQEHTIHRRDGRIIEKNSYGNDPVPPRDQR